LRRKLVTWLLLGTTGLILAVAALWGEGAAPGKGGRGQAVALVTVEGVITGGTVDLFTAGSSAGSVMEQLRLAREDASIAAVLLRINSPGGSAAASQEIADEVKRVREAGKPVVASLGDAAASGGYWIAAVTDRIVANPATITGSIGVIMETADLRELYDKIGIDFHVFKSGPLKDMGSPARDITPEERDVFQGMVNDIYSQFVQVVAEGRRMTEEEVRRLADGRVFTGRQAVELGLVDDLGNYYEALRILAEMAGLPPQPEVRSMAKPAPWWRHLLTVVSHVVAPWQQSGGAVYRLPVIR